MPATQDVPAAMRAPPARIAIAGEIFPCDHTERAAKPGPRSVSPRECGIMAAVFRRRHDRGLA